MSRKFKRKIKWRSVISVILVVAIALGVCGAIVSFSRSDTNTIGVGAFTRGALNEADGTYVKGKTSIVTEDLFECKGLKVIPDFDNTAQYQVFWYNEDEIYLGATDKMGASTKMVGSVPGAAVYARVVIYPSQTDEDGKAIKDFEIKFWEVGKYKSSIKIEVAKDQEELQQDLLNEIKYYSESMGTKYQAVVANDNIYFQNTNTAVDIAPVVDGGLIDCEGRDVIKLDCSNVSIYKVVREKPGVAYWYSFYKADGTFLGHSDVIPDYDLHFINVPKSGDEIFLVLGFYSSEEIPCISEYLYKELL